MSAQALLSGRSVVVFGGSSGLGKAVALACARWGAEIIAVADLQEEPREGGDSTCRAIGKINAASNPVFLQCDIRSKEQVARVLERAESAAPTDIVINTAAIYWSKSLLETDISDFDAMLAVNVRGALLIAQAAAKWMVPRRRGVIINTGSGAGYRGSARFTAYTASKGALRLLTYSLAAELGPHNVRVNQVDPAYMDTAMTRRDVPVVGREEGETLIKATIPLRRVSTLEEVADAYVYLASPLASYVTGHCLAVDGGNFTAAPDLSVLRNLGAS